MMDTLMGNERRGPAPGGPATEMIVSGAVPYGPGLPGYEWVTDHLVLIHPRALADLGSRMEPPRGHRVRIGRARELVPV
jgi:hypothetical protein